MKATAAADISGVLAALYRVQVTIRTPKLNATKISADNCECQYDADEPLESHTVLISWRILGVMTLIVLDQIL